LKKNCRHVERGFLSFWRVVPIIGLWREGAGLKNPVTASLAVALAKAGAETKPKLKKPLLLFRPNRLATVFPKML
jgi:hypothetical protein